MRFRGCQPLLEIRQQWQGPVELTRLQQQVPLVLAHTMVLTPGRDRSMVVERANKVIKQIFESEKYDLILQEAVFAGPRVDITDKVVKALNAQGGK